MMDGEYRGEERVAGSRKGPYIWRRSVPGRTKKRTVALVVERTKAGRQICGRKDPYIWRGSIPGRIDKVRCLDGRVHQEEEGFAG